MKRLIVFLILIFNITLLFGCSNVTYIVEYKSNGEITQTFSTSIDKQKLEENGYSYLTLSITINNLYENYWNNKYNDMKKNLSLNENLTVEEQLNILNSVKKEIIAGESEISLKITYPNSKIAQLVNTNPNEEDASNVRYKETLFTKTSIQNVTNIFAGYHESSLYQELNAVYNSENKFSDKDLELSHVIAFNSRRYKTNADEVEYKDGLYYHIWNVNTSKDENGEYASTKLIIKHTSPKPVAWYVLSASLTVMFIAGSFIYLNYKNKNKIS